MRAPTCPPLLPTFVGSWMSNAAVSAISLLASRGGAHRNAPEPPRRSPSSLTKYSKGGQSGAKT
jgi:hypothetical protein